MVISMIKKILHICILILGITSTLTVIAEGDPQRGKELFHGKLSDV